MGFYFFCALRWGAHAEPKTKRFFYRKKAQCRQAKVGIASHVAWNKGPGLREVLEPTNKERGLWYDAKARVGALKGAVKGRVKRCLCTYQGPPVGVSIYSP